MTETTARDTAVKKHTPKQMVRALVRAAYDGLDCQDKHYQQERKEEINIADLKGDCTIVIGHRNSSWAYHGLASLFDFLIFVKFD